MKNLCRKAYQHLSDHIPNLIENNFHEIFNQILDLLDSSSFDDRVSAAIAMQELCTRLSDEDLRTSNEVGKVVDKIHALISGKYFNNKEALVDGFMALLKVFQSLLNNVAFVNQFAGTCLSQIEKYSQQRL